MELPGEDKKQKIQVVHDIMLRYRTHNTYPSYYMFDIDMILYRAGKFQGKHIKLVAITNGTTVNIILAKIVGVVSEDNIVIYPYSSYDKKLLEENIPEDVDISNNNFTPKAEELVKKNRCLL